VDDNKAYFKFSEVVIIVIITCTFSIFAGISYGRAKYSNTVNINGLSDEKDEELKNFVKEYKNIINSYYDKDKIDEEQLLNAALKSVLEQLGLEDKYSTYMDDKTYKQVNIALDGKYEGLGISAYKEKTDGYIVVAGTFEESPAAVAGIKEDDLIISIDGKSTTEMTTSEFSTYVLYSEKKDFDLVIRRDKKDIKINISKGNIEIKSVESKIIERDNKKIGYIELGVFASNTYGQFKSHLEKLEKEGFDSLIIDLRGNTGGHLTEVTQIISLFLDKRHVIFQLQKDDNKTKYYSTGKEDKKYPIIFIGNELTASASEVFIISLKENLDAKLVGMKTYGKGTVQELVNLKNGDQYKITTKKWLSPKGNWINDTEGIEPDVEVQLNKTYINNPIEENDNQLEEAIKLALNSDK
jgi:carboxyl-terminal processing protease